MGVEFSTAARELRRSRRLSAKSLPPKPLTARRRANLALAQFIRDEYPDDASEAGIAPAPRPPTPRPESGGYTSGGETEAF